MHDGYPFEGLVGSRRSVGYDFPVEPRTKLARHLGQSTETDKTYRDSFADELVHMLPWGRRNDDSFTAYLDGPTPKQLETVLNAVSTHYGFANTLEDALRHLCEEAARDIVAGGAAFEIEYFHEPGNHEPEAFFIHSLIPGSVAYRRGRPIQFVPDQEGALRWKGMSYVDLDPKSLVEVVLEPTVIASLKAAEPTLALSRYQFLDASIMTSRNPKARTFEMPEYTRLEQEMILSGVKEVGWSAGMDNMLDPYKIWRKLQFMRFQFSVRDSILVAIAEILAQAGNNLGFTLTLRVEGLATIDDIADAEEALQAGSRSIAELDSFGLAKPPVRPTTQE